MAAARTASATTAIASSDLDGDAHSAEAVRHRIKELIDKEADGVLSDDTIVEFYVVDSAVAMMPALTRFDGRDSGAVQDL